MDSEKRIAFAISMTKIVEGVLAGTLTERAAASRLESGAKWLLALSDDPEIASEKSTKLGPSDDEIIEVFEHWRAVTGHTDTKLGRVHRGHIRACLARGATVEQMKAVSEWAAQSDWHQGNNPNNEQYDWPKNIFIEKNWDRNLEKARWRQRKERPVTVDSSIAAMKARRLEEEALDAHREGDRERYERLQQELGELTKEAQGDRRPGPESDAACHG